MSWCWDAEKEPWNWMQKRSPWDEELERSPWTGWRRKEPLNLKGAPELDEEERSLWTWKGAPELDEEERSLWTEKEPLNWMKKKGASELDEEEERSLWTGYWRRRVSPCTGSRRKDRGAPRRGLPSIVSVWKLVATIDTRFFFLWFEAWEIEWKWAWLNGSGRGMLGSRVRSPKRTPFSKSWIRPCVCSPETDAQPPIVWYIDIRRSLKHSSAFQLSF